jgi:hypothetical protein
MSKLSKIQYMSMNITWLVTDCIRIYKNLSNIISIYKYIKVHILSLSNFIRPPLTMATGQSLIVDNLIFLGGEGILIRALLILGKTNHHI